VDADRKVVGSWCFEPKGSRKMWARRVKLIFVNRYFYDGALVSELLLAKDYLVHGIKRRSSSFNTGRIEHLYQDPHEEGVGFLMHYGDMTDATDLINIVQETQPDEIYNMAAQGHEQVLFETPEYTANADALVNLVPARGHAYSGA
jgi:GDP-mannose 4,6-dehydratase